VLVRVLRTCGFRRLSVRASYLCFLGRPPCLPHCESFFLCLRAVAFPPFPPMHRGHTILVRGCRGQYVSLATPYFYPKTVIIKPPAAFFSVLGLLVSPTPTVAACAGPR
jgi:hypothetical protein